jgi:cellulose 1,4-beta-cellobiosidase
MSWNYIAYVSREPLSSVDLDIKAFIDDAVSRGFIDPEWFLDAIEAGFEIWRGGSGSETLSFSAHVEGG